MSAHLKELRVVDPVLTSLATGYSNDEFVAQTLMPFANVDKEGGKIPRYGKELFIVYATERSVAADSNLAKLASKSTIDFVLQEHDLGFPVDYRESAEDMDSAERTANTQAVDGIRLRMEVMVADQVQNSGNYAAENRAILSGGDKFTDPASDPEGVVDDGKAAVRAKVAKEPNTMVIGYSAFRTLKRHPKLKAILSDTRSRLVQLADLREMFEIPNIVIGKGVKVNDKGAQSDIWADNIVMAYVPPAVGGQQDARVPSFGYTLRKRGMPQTDTYPLPGGKVKVVRHTDIFTPLLLGADAGFLIKGIN
ncbi:hypothetical protein [Rhodoferax sp. BLA1]|uniref:major capsid protein n=1 Tax=Rhodoferax sp. BLA1 TaxID=2576062 RepID=UPI0015D1ED48|nr:hypothetical protein [Rhodoferax sp. BLA1]